MKILELKSKDLKITLCLLCQADVECTVLVKLHHTGYYMSYRETLLLMNMKYIHLNRHCYIVLIYFREFHIITRKIWEDLQHNLLLRPGPPARSEQVTWGFAPWGLADLQGTRHSLSDQPVYCLSVLTGKRFLAYLGEMPRPI